MHTRHYHHDKSVFDIIKYARELIKRDYRSLGHIWHTNDKDYPIISLSYCHDENKWSLIGYLSKEECYYTRLI